MSESDQFDIYNREGGTEGEISDPYTSESSADIYRTPDLSGRETDQAPVEKIQDADIIVEDLRDETVSEEQPETEDAYTQMEQAQEAEQEETAPQEIVFQEPDEPVYASRQVQVENPYENSPYGNNPYGNNPYGAPGGAYGGNPYNNGQNMQAGGAYTNGYGGPSGNPSYGSNGYGGPSGNPPYGNNVYNGNPYGGGNMQNTNPYGLSPYSGPSAQNNYQNPNSGAGNYYGAPPVNNPDPYAQNAAYGNGTPPYGGGYGGGVPPYGNNNPYSPYAAPPRKSNTGLIVGIVIAVILLLLAAVGALAYKVVTVLSEDTHRERNYEEYNHDYDDWERDRNGWDYDYDDPEYNYDEYDYDDDDWFKDDDYSYDYDSDPYYTLHDDIKENLSYAVDFEYFEYDTEYDNVEILVSYPVIKGADVPNLDRLNGAIQEEISYFTEYFEEDYEGHLSEDDYFSVLSAGYVTYMDEEKLSIVFNETVYSGYYGDVYLHCINIDMENGVILDNENILNADDDFSVEFRQRSDVQNGEIDALTRMSDQEITRLFNSDNVIVFYTPKGMEIGFNYNEGWVTVTYESYERYLKVF